MSRRDGVTADKSVSPAAPKEPGSTFFLWSGIVGAASGSLFFNLYHDSALLPTLLAVVAGFLPPFMSVVLGHAVKDVDQLWTKVGVFVVTICSMAVSAQGSSQVLYPALGEWGSYLLPITLDGADLILLFALIQHYEHARAYEQWLAARPGNQEAEPAAVVPAAAGTALVREPGTALPVPAAGSGLVPDVVPNPVPGTTEPEPGTIPEAVPVPAEPAVPVPAPGSGDTGPGPVKSPKPAKRNPKPSRTATPAASADDLKALRDKVVREIAGRPRPAMEHASQRLDRARAVLAEFKEFTGVQMNNQELGRALGVSKATAGEIRSALSKPADEEEDQAEGEGAA